MNTIQLQSTDDIIIPPGRLIAGEIQSQGKQTPDAIGELTVKLSGEVNFSDFLGEKLATGLMPTMVKAKRNDTNGIDVKAVILMNTINIPKLLVNQLVIVNNYGVPQIQFFIYCSKDELSKLKPTPDCRYKALTLSFTSTLDNEVKPNDIPVFPDGITMSDIYFVETFLWNIDPETSRGTETTVEDSDGVI